MMLRQRGRHQRDHLHRRVDPTLRFWCLETAPETDTQRLQHFFGGLSLRRVQSSGVTNNQNKMTKLHDLIAT